MTDDASAALDRVAETWWTKYGSTRDGAPTWELLGGDEQGQVREHVAPLVAACLDGDGPGESLLPELLADVATLGRSRDRALTQLARTRGVLAAVTDELDRTRAAARSRNPIERKQHA